MALKAFYNTAAEVPEGLRDHYVLKDGKYVLDADGLVPKSRLDEFRDNNVNLTKEIQKMKELYKGIDDPEKARQAQAQIQELEDLKLFKEGKLDLEGFVSNRVSRMEKDYSAQIEALNGQVKQTAEAKAALHSKLAMTLIESEVMKSLSDLAVIRPGAATDISSRAHSAFTINDTGEIVARENFYGKDGKPLQPKEFVQSLVKDAPFLFESASGHGGRGGAGNHMIGKTISIGDLDSSMSGDLLSKMAKGEISLTE